MTLDAAICNRVRDRFVAQQCPVDVVCVQHNQPWCLTVFVKMLRVGDSSLRVVEFSIDEPSAIHSRDYFTAMLDRSIDEAIKVYKHDSR